MRIRTSSERKDQGFTLIELLVVVVIIGILAAIAIPVFLNQRDKAVEAGIKSDMKNAATAQEAYLTDNPTYTTSIATLVSDYGLKLSDKSAIAATISTDEGYCITGGRDDNGDGTIDADPGVLFYYDSALGGLSDTNEADGIC